MDAIIEQQLFLDLFYQSHFTDLSVTEREKIRSGTILEMLKISGFRDRRNEWQPSSRDVGMIKWTLEISWSNILITFS